MHIYEQWSKMGIGVKLNLGRNNSAIGIGRGGIIKK